MTLAPEPSGRTEPAGAGTAAVAAGHPATVNAARDILDQGGNAFDAAIAAACVAAVAEPGLTSLGGGGFLLADPVGEEPVLIDFFVDTPGRGSAVHDVQMTPVDIRFGGAVQRFNVGYGSVAVPGCLAGYLHIHQRWGSLDLTSVLRPAIQTAREGVEISRFQAQFFALLEPIFTLTEQGRRIFAPGGRFLGQGDLCTNPWLADFFEHIAATHPSPPKHRRDAALGRTGHALSAAIADQIGHEMAAHGGLVTATDLNSYRVIERAPLRIVYGGVEVFTNPPPSFGGSIVTAALTSMGTTPASERPRPGSAAAVAALVGSLRDAVDVHRRRPPFAPLQASKGTTHISVVDALGNVATMTTSNGSGSGVFLAETGIHANNIMGEEDLHPEGLHSEPAGLRVGSMMAPTIVRWPEGRKVALGTGGSERIRSAIAQTLSHLIDAGESISDAVKQPRFHWDGAVLQCEPGFDIACMEQLAASMPVNRWETPDLYFGGVHAVDTDGHAVGDTRRGGQGWVSTPG